MRSSGDFVRLFELGCANALFLDGSVSSLFAPNLGRNDDLLPLGPLLGALPRPEEFPAREVCSHDSARSEPCAEAKANHGYP